MKAAARVVAGTVVLFLLAGFGLWLWGEEPTGAPTPPPVPPAPRRDVGAEEFRQWLRQLPLGQKVGLLRVLIGSLREDVVAQQRRAAEQWFHRADADGNGQLSFEEAWQAGLFREAAARRDVRPGAGPQAGPVPQEERERSRGERPRAPEATVELRDQRERERRPNPEANAAPGEQPPFPTSELEQDLLESWDLLQELNIIARDTGGK